MFMVVVLPAPFGPKNPKNSPSLTSKDMLFTAVRPLYLLTRSVTSMIGIKLLTMLSEHQQNDDTEYNTVVCECLKTVPCNETKEHPDDQHSCYERNCKTCPED